MENAKVNAKSKAPVSKAIANAVTTPQPEQRPDIRMPETLISPSAGVEKTGDDRQELVPFAETRKSGNLPDHVQAKMERSFGQSFSDVEVVTNSDKAKSLDAIAFTQGSTIHVAPGYDPYSSSGQELLGHELSHVVQQRQGRVTPTHYEGGVGVNDSVHLESEANRHGTMAARGELINGGKIQPFISRGTVQKKSAVIQMWRPLPGQARVESTAPDIEGAWRAVRGAISGAVNAWVGDIASEFRAALIGRISEELQGGLGTISLNNFKTYSGLNLTWRGTIQFMIDGIREISGGGVGSTVIGSGGSTTTGLSVTGTETGGTTGGATVSSSPGSGGGTGGSANAGVSSGTSTARTNSASHTSSATSASTVSQVLTRYRASVACFVNLSAESSVGDSGWDYVNPFQWGVAVGNAITGDAHGSASSNCGTVTYYEGSGISR